MITLNNFQLNEISMSGWKKSESGQIFGRQMFLVEKSSVYRREGLKSHQSLYANDYMICGNYQTVKYQT